MSVNHCFCVAILVCIATQHLLLNTSSLGLHVYLGSTESPFFVYDCLPAFMVSYIHYCVVDVSHFVPHWQQGWKSRFYIIHCSFIILLSEIYLNTSTMVNACGMMNAYDRTVVFCITKCYMNYFLKVTLLPWIISSHFFFSVCFDGYGRVCNGSVKFRWV